jgi:NAD(P)-dependent dehydrogenase (short-subunit alcohol dehydrogenase family)
MPRDGSGLKAVLVTGASTGIGRTCALHLDAVGWRVFAGVRRPEDGAALEERGSERLLALPLDVTDASSIEGAVRVVDDALGAPAALHALVNNAGVSEGGPLELIEMERLRHQFEVNVVGTVAVTQAFLPMLRRAPGRIVNVGSIQGFMALPFSGAYAASKHALEALSDSLRRELRPWGIAVSLLEPGAVATEMWDKSLTAAEGRLAAGGPRQELYAERGRRMLARVAKERRGRPPEAVARVIEHALTARRPPARYRVGADAKVVRLLTWLLPDRVLDSMFSRALG